MACLYTYEFLVRSLCLSRPFREWFEYSELTLVACKACLRTLWGPSLLSSSSDLVLVPADVTAQFCQAKVTMTLMRFALFAYNVNNNFVFSYAARRRCSLDATSMIAVL
jgi:hypothetical protein